MRDTISKVYEVATGFNQLDLFGAYTDDGEAWLVFHDRLRMDIVQMSQETYLKMTNDICLELLKAQQDDEDIRPEHLLILTGFHILTEWSEDAQAFCNTKFIVQSYSIRMILSAIDKIDPHYYAREYTNEANRFN